MKVDQKLYDSAINLILSRFGKIITSTSPEGLNEGVSLYHETGAFY